MNRLLKKKLALLAVVGALVASLASPGLAAAKGGHGTGGNGGVTPSSATWN